MSTPGSLIGISDTLAHMDSTELSKLNTASQITAAVLGAQNMVNPAVAAAAVQAGLFAAATQTAVLAHDMNNGAGWETLTADIASLVGNLLISTGAIASVTGAQPVAMFFDGVGDGLTLLGTGINNWPTVRDTISGAVNSLDTTVTNLGNAASSAISTALDIARTAATISRAVDDIINGNGSYMDAAQSVLDAFSGFSSGFSWPSAADLGIGSWLPNPFGPPGGSGDPGNPADPGTDPTDPAAAAGGAGGQAGAASGVGGGSGQISPLVLDLTGAGINLTALSPDSPYFDLTGSGFARKTGRIGAGTGLLCLDRNGNGNIDDITELFGSNGAANGFAALSALDANGDGVIDASDPQYANLRVWVDNGDGVTQAGELRSLADLGIASISLSFAAVSQTVNGNTLRQVGRYTLTDGTTRAIADAWFANSATYTRPDVAATPSAEVAALPQLGGSGRLTDLRSAMMADATLQAEVQSLVASEQTAPGSLTAAVETLLLEWSGSAAINPASRGGLFDARKLGHPAHMDSRRRMAA